MNINHLSLSWSTSRGRDTYGYNICRLDDRNDRRRFKCMGGGYDMIGTVFGDWLEANYQERLVELFNGRDESNGLEECGYAVKGYYKLKGLYGMTIREGKVSLDGGCGIESMIRIAEAIGLEVEREGDRKGRTIGFYVQDIRA